MDLYQAACLIALMSVLTLLLGLRLGGAGSPRRQLTLQILVLIVGMGYYLTVWDRPILTRLLPHTSLIVLANLHPVFGCFFAGMYFRAKRIRAWRRALVGPATVVLAGYAIVAPLTGQPPHCEEDSGGTLVAQSTPFTCSPAVGASLLRLHGIQVSESLMAELCLTREGTHWLGLYRGLKIMTQDTEWDVEVCPFSRQAVLELGNRPAILSLNLDTARMGLTEEYGFRADAGHSVLQLKELAGGKLLVFDPSPSFGLEIWESDILTQVSTGVIISLGPASDLARTQEVAARVQLARGRRDRFAQVSMTETAQIH